MRRQVGGASAAQRPALGGSARGSTAPGRAPFECSTCADTQKYVSRYCDVSQEPARVRTERGFRAAQRASVRSASSPARRRKAPWAEAKAIRATLLILPEEHDSIERGRFLRRS